MKTALKSILVGACLIACVALQVCGAERVEPPRTEQPASAIGEPTLWKISDLKLSPDGKRCIIEIEPTKEASLPGAKPVKLLMSLSTENRLVTYEPESGLKMEKFVFDGQDDAEVEKLKAITRNFSRCNREAEGQAFPEPKPEIKAFRNFEVSYEVQYADRKRPYGGAIWLNPPSENEDNLRIDEPTALLFALNQLQQIRAMHLKAVEEQQIAKLAKEKFEQEKMKANVGNAKALAEQEVRNFEEAKQREVAAIGVQKELEAIEVQKQKQKMAIVEKYRKEAAQKILAFLATKDGKALQEKISKTAKNAAEIAADTESPIDVKKEELATVMRAMQDPSTSSSERRWLAQRVNAITTVELPNAQRSYVEPEKLREVRAKLRTLMVDFKEACGMDYQEAMELTNSSANSRQ